MDKWFYNPGSVSPIAFQNFTNWYSAPGGPSGGGTLVSYPVAGDNAYLTSESGTGTITINNVVQVDILDCTGFAGTVSGNGNLYIYKEIILGSTVNFSLTNLILIYGYLINCSNNIFNGGTIQIYSASGGNPVCDTTDLKINGGITLVNGELRTHTNFNTYGLEAKTFVANSSDTKSFFQSDSTNNEWKITGNSGYTWYVDNVNTTCIDPAYGRLGIVTFTGSFYGTGAYHYFFHSTSVIGEPAEVIVAGDYGSNTGFSFTSSKVFDIVFTCTGNPSIYFGGLTLLGNINFNNTYVIWSNDIIFSTGSHSLYFSPNMSFTVSNFNIGTGVEVIIETNPGSVSIAGNINITGGLLTANDNFLNGGTFTINGGTFDSSTRFVIGSVSITNGSITNYGLDNRVNGSVTINSGGSFENNGELSISGNTVINSGGYFNSYVKTTMNGTLIINDGTYDALWDDTSSLNSVVGTLTLNSGNVFAHNLSIGAFSSSNSNGRSVQVTNLFFTGIGTILSISAANQTNLGFYVENITVRANDSSSRTLTLNNAVSVYGNVTLEGNGNGATTMTFVAASDNFPWVIVTKQNGSLNLGTSTMRSLTFVEGSTILWSSTSTINIIEQELRLCNSMSVGSTPGSITFPVINEYDSPSFYTANKNFTGTLVISSLYGLKIYGNYTSTSSSTSAISVSNYGQVIFYNNISLPNNGNIAISSGQGTGSGYFANVTLLGNTTIGTIGWTDADVFISSTTLAGSINASSSGSLYVYPNSIINIGVSFVSSSTVNQRYIDLTNAIINLNGTGTIWNMLNGTSQGVLNVSGFEATINVNNKSTALCTLALGGNGIGNININRTNNAASSTTSTTFSGVGNAHRNFRDFTILPSSSVHQITFAGTTTGIPTYIHDTFQVGNTTNRTNLVSSSTNRFFLQKINPGLVICPNVAITNSTALNSNTWYAISGSVNNGGNTNWIFNSVVPRRLSSLGAG